MPKRVFCALAHILRQNFVEGLLSNMHYEIRFQLLEAAEFIWSSSSETHFAAKSFFNGQEQKQAFPVTERAFCHVFFCFQLYKQNFTQIKTCLNQGGH